MTDREQGKIKAKTAPPDIHAEENEKLPYRIELWNNENAAVERVLARAATAALGRAIFKAALTENPDRRITLRRGARIILDSSEQ